MSTNFVGPCAHGSDPYERCDICGDMTAEEAEALAEAAKDITQPREPGCQCHQEVGDSPCAVHDSDEGEAP